MPESPAATVPAGKSPQLVPLPNDSLNFGTPLHLVQGNIVPNELFFLRSNYPPPAVEPAAWQLRIDGLVRRPAHVGLADVQRLPTRKQVCWLECAGNSRANFRPATEGNQWQHHAVSNAEFTGVSLRDVLELAGGFAPGAREVVVSGADDDRFQRALPVDVALHPDVMLVWAMNGEAIPWPNGGPVRLVVPRWGGVASVKWPKRMEAIAGAFAGYYHKERYVIFDEAGLPKQPVREMPVKSVIAAPEPGAQVARDRTVRVFGFAWSGYGAITGVKVSADGGATWLNARLIHEGGRNAWTRWEYDWTPTAAGATTLQAQAQDDQGNVQPLQARWNPFGYQMNGVERVPVAVV